MKGESGYCSKCVKGSKLYTKQLRTHRKNQHKQEIHNYLWRNAVARAKVKDLPIQKHRVDIPDYCPILGLKLAVADGVLSDSSYSFDRIIPELGYVPGNVICISQRANRIKNDSTLEELEKIFYFYRDFK